MRRYHCVNLHILWLCEVDTPIWDVKRYYRKLKNNVFIKSKIKAQCPAAVSISLDKTIQMWKKRGKLKARMITTEYRDWNREAVRSLLKITFPSVRVKTEWNVNGMRMIATHSIVVAILTRSANAIVEPVCDARLTSGVEHREWNVTMFSLSLFPVKCVNRF